MSEVNNACIAGKNLVSFSGVSSQHRDDIMDVLMLADFRATQTWRPHSQWTSWINNYRSHLISSGFQLKSQIVKPAMVINCASELDNVSLGVTGSLCADNLMDLARRSFKAARLTEHARQFFEFGTEPGRFGTFQVVPCEHIGSNDVAILICALHASANLSSESRGGDWRINREMVVRLAGGVYHFNGDRHAEHRARIQARLDGVGRLDLQHLSV